MDTEVHPCAAGSEAMRMRSMTMRAQVKGSEDHGDCEEGRERKHDRGRCIATCREAWKGKHVPQRE